MNPEFKTDIDVFNLFYKEEIGDYLNTIDFYLDFLLDDNRQGTSGDSLYIEKEKGALLIGNLFDDEFPKLSIKSDVFAEFLKQKRKTISGSE